MKIYGCHLDILGEFDDVWVVEPISNLLRCFDLPSYTQDTDVRMRKITITEAKTGKIFTEAMPDDLQKATGLDKEIMPQLPDFVPDELFDNVAVNDQILWIKNDIGIMMKIMNMEYLYGETPIKRFPKVWHLKDGKLNLIMNNGF